jgi:hypothetical protein
VYWARAGHYGNNSPVVGLLVEANGKRIPIEAMPFTSGTQVSFLISILPYFYPSLFPHPGREAITPALLPQSFGNVMCL